MCPACASTASAPAIRGLDHAVSLAEGRAFFASLGPGSGIIVKALAGGGGRGTRAVLSADDLDAAFDDVIDPADTRGWIASGLKRLPRARTIKKYPYIDPW